jgi:hypothetical protein
VTTSEHSCLLLEVPALVSLGPVGFGRVYNPTLIPHQREGPACCLAHLLEQLTAELTLFACSDLCPDGGLFFGDRQRDSDIGSLAVNARALAHHFLVRCHADSDSLKLLCRSVSYGVGNTLCRSTTWHNYNINMTVINDMCRSMNIYCNKIALPVFDE